MASTLDTTPRTPLERALDRALHECLDEKASLRAENARLKARLDALASAFDGNGVVGVLQQVAHDRDLPAELRVKAATAAAPYEKPKLSMTATANVTRLFDTLERDRLAKLATRTIEHGPAERGCEHAPAPDPAA